MNGIQMLDSKPINAWQRTGETGIKIEGETVSPTELISKVPRTDQTEFSAVNGQNQEVRRREEAERILAELAKRYPKIHVSVGDEKTGDDIAKLAAALGKGNHFLVSEEFLKRMCSSEEEFQKCREALEEIVKKLSGQSKEGANGVFVGKSEAVFWSVGQDRFQDTGSQQSVLTNPESIGLPAPDLKQKDALKVKATLQCNVSRRYVRMAGANSKNQVQAVMSDVRRDIVNLRMASSFGDREDQLKANRVIRSLNKLLTRGGRKIKCLNREETVAARERKAERERELEEKLRAAVELKKRKNARVGGDKALLMEGMTEQARIRGCRYYQRARDAYLESSLTYTPNFSFGASAGGVDTGSLGGKIESSDVVISDTMSF